MVIFRGAYWRGAALLGGMLSSMWVFKGATKVLRLSEEMW